MKAFVGAADMTGYQPGLSDEDFPMPEPGFPTFRRLVPASHPDFLVGGIQLGVLASYGYDPEDSQTVERALFLVDYFRRQRQRTGPPLPIHPVATGEPVVYYMRMRDLIKIGTTRNLERRQVQLLADAILAVEAGGVDVERARHLQFAHLQFRGERFYPAPDLLAHIQEIREAA